CRSNIKSGAAARYMNQEFLSSYDRTRRNFEICSRFIFDYAPGAPIASDCADSARENTAARSTAMTRPAALCETCWSARPACRRRTPEMSPGLETDAVDLLVATEIT